MKKTTKKLVINREKLRELVDTNLERVQGGYPHSATSDWCSSDGAHKCTYTCATGNYSQRCVNN